MPAVAIGGQGLGAGSSAGASPDGATQALG